MPVISISMIYISKQKVTILFRCVCGIGVGVRRWTRASKWGRWGFFWCNKNEYKCCNKLFLSAAHLDGALMV